MSARPTHDPKALETAAARLQAAAEALRQRGVPLSEVQELADAARAYAAGHALAKLARSGMTTTSPVYLSGASTARHVKSVALPLTANDHGNEER